MKRSIGLWQLIAFGVTAISGTLLHFLYDWSGEAIWTAPFSGVNESTWEHMKLLFWPMFIYAVIESFFFREIKDFWCVKLYGITLGILLIPTIFYTYNGSIGRSPDWLNISIFFICAALSYIFETRRFKSDTTVCKKQTFSFFLLCLLALSFVIFTFDPPELGIFRDPIDGGYGI